MATNPPDIVFILIDDMGWADLGCQGSSFYETPRLDALAAEGMRFTDAYAAAPVCSPTRASLLTGRYPARVGITQYIPGHNTGPLADVPYFHFLPRHELTVAAALREGGYRTWHVGKWHLGGAGSLPTDHGFDVNIGGSSWGMPHRGYFSPYGMPGLADGPEGEYLTDRLTDEAIALVQSHREERPFFLQLNHYAVHTPIQAPAALVEKYRAKARALGLDQRSAIEAGDEFGFLEKRGRRIERRRFQSDPDYAAMIENLDTNIGRLVDALKAAGRWENTLLIFTSDNGGLATAEGSPTCNAPLAEGKGWTEEGGNREPFIVTWPAVVPPASRCGEPVTSPDVFPTLLEAAGLPARPAQHLDGMSFLPALEGKPFRRGPIFWHYPHYSNQGGKPAGAVREDAWKLIEWFEDGRIALYNLAEDPGETRDLASERPEVAKRLLGLLREWRAEVGAVVPRPNAHWIAPHND
jgi:arylsulfatase A-like enzyme